LEIVALWHGGMAFHGGLIGVLLAIWYVAHKSRVRFFTVADICAVTAPIPIFLVRVGNFIQQEHYGRPTGVPWAVVFPEVDSNPRHPSQLYEAILEGLLLLVVLGIFARKGAFRRPGLLTGVAALGYGLARIAMEFFREPDPDIEQLSGGLTMGMALSAPMILIGAGIIIYSLVMARRNVRKGAP
jgi:phosphatidylglycerol:prolipoprotein diacylglycerol transferase